MTIRLGYADISPPRSSRRFIHRPKTFSPEQKWARNFGNHMDTLSLASIITVGASIVGLSLTSNQSSRATKLAHRIFQGTLILGALGTAVSFVGAAYSAHVFNQ